MRVNGRSHVLGEVGAMSGEGDGSVGGWVEFLLIDLTLVGEVSEEEQNERERETVRY